MATDTSEPLADAAEPEDGADPSEADPTETIVLDASEPPDATVPHPPLGAQVVAWAQLAVPTVVVNLVILAIASAAGATMMVETGPGTVEVGPTQIAFVTGATLLIATLAWGLVAHRTPAFAQLWVPLTVGAGLLSLAMLIGVSDLGTGLALGTMHACVTAVAALLLPRRLPHHGK